MLRSFASADGKARPLLLRILTCSSVDVAALVKGIASFIASPLKKQATTFGDNHYEIIALGDTIDYRSAIEPWICQHGFSNSS